GMKLVLPLAALTAQMHMPGAFLRVLGVLEIAGALGLVLPGLFHTRTRLTPLAAAGLVVIMAGATSATMITMGVLAATGPVAIGVIAGLIGVGRWETSSFR
ncbi:MAG TPA: DoxX family protein, partial [Vicinamibacterales bacterium]|nr:DoxX family protein [Vicinamibacterales bacterium]